MKKISVLVFDDSAVMRHMFKAMLSEVPDIEVVGVTADVQTTREQIKSLNPDVLLLGVGEPSDNALDFLEKVMRLRPMPVIMAAPITPDGAASILQSLELGAVDYVFKFSTRRLPDLADQLQLELEEKIRIAAAAQMSARRSKSSKQAQILAFLPPSGEQPIIAIGASTGGVEALRDMFMQLPANCPPVLVVQHMPPTFTTSFAARLNAVSQMTVVEAYDGAKLQEGQAWLAPGGQHLRIARHKDGFVCRIDTDPPVSGHRPSVDTLFGSVAEVAGARSIAVILTGMGKDGAQGMLKIRDAGGYTIGQDKDSSLIYGMPRAAAEAGALKIALPLHDIAQHMLEYCQRSRSKGHAASGA